MDYLITESPLHIVFLIYAVWNVIVFLMYGLDKLLSKTQLRRISEKTLLTSAFVLGGIGALLGMSTFRHKTKHTNFVVCVPLFAGLNILIICLFLYGKAKNII